MPWAEIVGGTHTIAAVSSTEEEVFAARTDGKTYVWWVDLANLAGSDAVVLRIYAKARSSTSERLLWDTWFMSTQGRPLTHSPVIPNAASVRGVINQNAGTARTFPWSLQAPD